MAAIPPIAFRRIRSLILGLTLAASVGTLRYPDPAAAQQSAPAAAVTAASPEALVRSLYKLHNRGYGPIFNRPGKPYLSRYFDAPLAALLWKNIVGPPSGEVGNLDFDPLFNAQDLGLAELRIGPAQKQKDPTRALVPVTFKNYGRPNRILFHLRKTDAGWRIHDLDYGGGQRLVSLLSQPF